MRSSTLSARSTVVSLTNAFWFAAGASCRWLNLEDWMRAERAKLSRHAEVAKAMDYMLKRWAAFSRFLDALGRKSWLFAGSDRGGERAAIMYTSIQTAKLNGIDPQAWLADV